MNFALFFCAHAKTASNLFYCHRNGSKTETDCEAVIMNKGTGDWWDFTGGMFSQLSSHMIIGFLLK